MSHGRRPPQLARNAGTHPAHGVPRAPDKTLPVTLP